MKPRNSFILILILAAAAARLFPHWPNVSPIAAMALFGGATFANKRLAYLFPLAAMALSDIFLGFYPIMLSVYACFIATTFIGIKMKGKIRPRNIAVTAVGSGVMFFVVTNFFVWVGGSMCSIYPYNLTGFITCYVAALPYFAGTLASNLGYSVILFGSLYLAELKLPSLRPVKI